jgi:hypothetical protein
MDYDAASVMATRGELFSTRSHTPKRSYFFNVKQNRNGQLFLNVVESKKNEGTEGGKSTFDDYERRSVVVFEEDLPDFFAALEKAVGFVRKNGRPPRIRKRVEYGEHRPPAGARRASTADPRPDRPQRGGPPARPPRREQPERPQRSDSPARQPARPPARQKIRVRPRRK